MSYTIDRVIDSADFEEVDRRTRAALANHGFGVLTEIDVKETMKKEKEQAIDDDDLKAVAGEVRDMLDEVVQEI